jgi:hypothetical protein
MKKKPRTVSAGHRYTASLHDVLALLTDKLPNVITIRVPLNFKMDHFRNRTAEDLDFDGAATVYSA